MVLPPPVQLVLLLLQMRVASLQGCEAACAGHTVDFKARGTCVVCVDRGVSCVQSNPSIVQGNRCCDGPLYTYCMFLQYEHNQGCRKGKFTC
jgi:hypothetical protein